MAHQHEQHPDDHSKELLHLTDDRDIIRRILEGEKDLYALIVRKYNQRLYRVGMSIINIESEVEDVMQSAFIKAFEHLEKFHFRSGFATWLTKILVNECLLHLKKKGRSARGDRVSGGPETRAIDLQTPLMKVLNSELKMILKTSIRGLPEKYRTVFVMREIENLSVAETMECLELSEANVKIRLNRAKVMLRDKLSAYLKDDEILQLYQAHCDRIVDVVMKVI
jgi:RNA polymerase sigma factor (sigma-70 family)